MKLNAIKTACLQENTFLIINKPDGEQWIGNRHALWPVEGITLHRGNIPAVFDLDDKKMEKIDIIVRELYGEDYDSRITREPMQQEEVLCEVAEACIWHKGGLYRPIHTEDGVMLLDVSLLKPAENKEGFMEFYIRKPTEGGLPTLIACYGNMFVDGLVLPVEKDTAERIMNAAKVVIEMPLAETNTFDGAPEADVEQTVIGDGE